jgi:hypothetical protein
VADKIARRTAALIRQLIAEQEEEQAKANMPTRGARASVERRLGLPVGYLSQLSRGLRRPTTEFMSVLSDRIGLRPDYFFAAGPDDLDYRQYLSVTKGDK